MAKIGRPKKVRLDIEKQLINASYGKEAEKYLEGYEDGYSEALYQLGERK